MSVESFLPDGVELNNLLEKLRELCWSSADILMAYARGEKPPYGYSQALSVEEEGDGPVSAADLAVNDWLLRGFESNFPDVDWYVLSEETAKNQLGKSFSLEHEWIWILDPLDGTKDFLKGTGDYAVHLGLVHNNKAVLGIVLIPESDELWFGVTGEGSWYENRIGEKKFVSFSERNKVEEMILVASRSHRDIRLENLINSLQIGEQKSIGSVGCKVCSILKGESDFYISLSGETAPKDWDLAAPEAVITAAGGKFTHADEKPLYYNTGDFSQRGCLVASNGSQHIDICKKVFKAISLIDPKFKV